MYFECESMLRSEDGFLFPSPFSLDRLLRTQMITHEQHGIPKHGGVNMAIGCSDIMGGMRWQGGWIGLIQDYSMRKLSVAQDKLPALSGLARIIPQRTQDRYFAAPSWSWASLDAPIRFIPLTYGDLVAEVINCETTPSGSDMYGKVKAGKLVIEGPVFKILPHEPKEEWKRQGIPVKIQFDGSERIESIGALYLDLPRESLQFPCYAFFIDPANALVLSTCPSHTDTVLGKISGDDLSPLPLVTSEDARRHIQGPPKVIGLDYTRGMTFEAFASAKRIGVASFVKGFEPDPKEVGKTEDKILDNADELDWDDIIEQSGNIPCERSNNSKISRLREASSSRPFQTFDLSVLTGYARTSRLSHRTKIDIDCRYRE
ncbi:uncharacterized protein PAC_10220 [Phialocephala subalpina]|uniref:Uncharacterized protein n=1 Tax=Phialocephala subalpina TaxID=576137 RepID=A0A1L7X5M9_9HELO|nr:uncharacterized protein PAC_10220 [Phialocephala subalpina]